MPFKVDFSSPNIPASDQKILSEPPLPVKVVCNSHARLDTGKDDSLASTSSKLSAYDANIRKYIEYTYDMSQKEIDSLYSDFNPQGKNICAFGSTFNYIMRACKKTIPDDVGNNLMKRYGPYITTTNLTYENSSFFPEIRLSIAKSKNQNNQKNAVDFIPVVIIGEGMGENKTPDGDIDLTKKQYNGLHPRIIAMEDKNDRARVAEWLKQEQEKTGDIFIGTLRFCYFNDLVNSCSSQYEYGPPDITSLLEKCLSLKDIE